MGLVWLLSALLWSTLWLLSSFLCHWSQSQSHTQTGHQCQLSPTSPCSEFFWGGGLEGAHVCDGFWTLLFYVLKVSHRTWRFPGCGDRKGDAASVLRSASPNFHVWAIELASQIHGSSTSVAFVNARECRGLGRLNVKRK